VQVWFVGMVPIWVERSIGPVPGGPPPRGGGGRPPNCPGAEVPEIKYGKPGNRFRPFSPVIDIMIPCIGRLPNSFSVLVLSIEMLISVLSIIVRARGTSLHLTVPFILMFATPCKTVLLLAVVLVVLLLVLLLETKVVAFEGLAPDIATVSFVIVLTIAVSATVPLGLILSRFIVKFWILLFTTSRLQFPPTIVPNYFEGGGASWIAMGSRTRIPFTPFAKKVLCMARGESGEAADDVWFALCASASSIILSELSIIAGATAIKKSIESVRITPFCILLWDIFVLKVNAHYGIYEL
jgi:hypothetical protein